MTETPPHLFREQGIAAGHPPEILDRAYRQVLRNHAQGSQPILTLNHLAHLTGVNLPYLRDIVGRQRYEYRDLTVPKRSGASRPIAAPNPLLLEVQRVILRRALNNLPLHPSCYAYRRGRSIVQCAEQHIGARWLVKLDLHNFFGHIRERRVYKVFRGQGYSSLTAFELTRLCTCVPPGPPEVVPPVDGLQRRYPVIPHYVAPVPGYLPQGAPTSGALANAVATGLDHRLADLSLAEGLVYTRYSDDLTFSAGAGYSRDRAARFIKTVREAVDAENFRLHYRKTRVIPPGTRHIVLGLLVDDRVRLLPEFRRRVEAHIRGIGRFGVSSHADHRKFRSIFSMLSHIEGSLAFAAEVDPVWTARTREKWNEALVLQGLVG